MAAPAANLLQLGTAPYLATSNAAPAPMQGPAPREMLLDLAPTSIVDAAARDDVVRIVVSASLFGAASGLLEHMAAERVQMALGDLAAFPGSN